eukprot:scaffold73255_cov60-Phaeocystis_antarctica.AAC.5
MLQHILKKNLLLITASASEPAPASAPRPASASEYHLQAATRYGRMLPTVHKATFTKLLSVGRMCERVGRMCGVHCGCAAPAQFLPPLLTLP